MIAQSSPKGKGFLNFHIVSQRSYCVFSPLGEDAEGRGV